MRGSLAVQASHTAPAVTLGGPRLDARPARSNAYRGDTRAYSTTPAAAAAWRRLDQDRRPALRGLSAPLKETSSGMSIATRDSAHP